MAMSFDFSALGSFVAPKYTPPENAEIFRNIQYSSQGHVRQRLDLYIPKPELRRHGKIPVIVYIHGTITSHLLIFHLIPLNGFKPLPTI